MSMIREYHNIKKSVPRGQRLSNLASFVMPNGDPRDGVLNLLIGLFHHGFGLFRLYMHILY